MRFNNVNVEALAYHLPDSVITSEDLENRMAPLYEKLKLPLGRLQLMTGIRERRFWDEGVMPSEISTLAGEKVLAKSGIDRYWLPPFAVVMMDASISTSGFERNTHGKAKDGSKE